MNKYFLPYDVFERHKKVASFISASDSIVDIGGELNHLSQFCRSQKIIVANLNTGDVIITKDKIPFENNSFDIVCSIDVLEHLPKNKRQEFVDKLASIAKKKVVLSFPIGTAQHITYEKKMSDWLENRGENLSYLREHIRHGLPTKKEIDLLTKNFKTKISFSGDIKANEFLFKIFIFDPKVKYVRKIIYFLKLIFNAATNILFYKLLTGKNYSNRINRAYVQINKHK